MKKNNKKYNQKSKYTLTENSLNNTNKRNWWFIYIIIAFVVPVLLYVQTINFKFTNFDDDIIISKNISFLSDFKNAGKTFLTDAFILTDTSFVNNGSFYRPMQTLSYMIDIQLSGVNATWMFHLSNILLLGLISCMIFLLLVKFLIPPKLSLISTLIFCANPLFVSSIAWIPARGDLQLTLFSLLSFLFFIEFMKNKKFIYLALNCIAFAFAIFCKETAIFLPFLFVLYYFLFSFDKRFDKKYLLAILFYGITGIFWFWLRSKAVGGILNHNKSVGIMPIIINLPTIPESIIKFLLPFDNNPLPCFSDLKIIAGLIIIITMVIVFFIIKERTKKEKIFWILWFLVLMLPPMLYKSRLIDYLDHRFFLPMIGILLFLLFSIPKKWFYKGDIKRLWILIVIFVFLSSFTIIKSRAYTDPITFYNTSIDHNQNSALAYFNRANIQKDRNNLQESIMDYNKAISILPYYAEAYNNRGETKNTLKDYQGAIKDFDNAIAYRQNYLDAYNNRGVARENIGDNKGAIEDYNMVIALRPNYALAYNNRGEIKANLNDLTGAIEDYNKAIAIKPKYSEAYNNKGIAMASSGNLKEAIINFNKAIEINPNNLDIYFNRAYTRYNLKDLAGTITDCEEVLKLNSNDQNALNLKAKAQQELQKK